MNPKQRKYTRQNQVLVVSIFRLFFTFQWFNFPLSVTVVHFSMVFVMAAAARLIWECKTQEKRVILSWPVYMKRVFPTGRSTC